jgi:FtsH-binding integral membrane protein
VDEAPEWGPLLRGERRAGRFLARVAVTSAATTLLGGLIAMPLALLHLWRPIVALPVVLVMLAVAIRASRCVMARPMPPWSLVLCLLIAVGAGLWAGATHDEHVVLRRDAGSYALYAQQLADKHQLPIDAHVNRLGGASVVDDPDVVIAGPGFYEQGHGDDVSVVPQFLIGAPAWYSVGMWVGGWTGLLVTPAVFLALAIVSVAALAAATIGPRWAPLVALATALTAPVLHAGRSTYSEIPALLALSAAMTLLAAATEQALRRPERADRMGLLAGLLLGGAGLVRLDALREVVLLIPVLVLLAVRRQALARQVALGTAMGLAGSALVAVVLARPYLRLVSSSLLPLVALGAVGVAAGFGGLAWLRRRERTPAPVLVRWLPWAFAALVLLAGVALATRPWWLVGHQGLHDPSGGSIAVMQAAQGLPVDRTRTYSEQSLTWVVWWTGLSAVLLAWIGATLAAYRCGRVLTRGQPLPPWIGPFVVGSGSILLILLRPGITPDHPWADRRLVVSVLPGVLLLATGAVAQLVRLARRRAPLPVLAAAVLVGVVAVAGPAWLATRPLDRQRTELGELGAARTVCASFRPGDVAVAVGERTTNEWLQVLRGICDVPTLGLHVRDTSTSTEAGRARLATALDRVLPEVQAGGGRVVLVADREDLLRSLGVSPTQLVLVHTLEDQRLLTQRPSGSEPLDINLWSAPAPPAAGQPAG